MITGGPNVAAPAVPDHARVTVRPARTASAAFQARRRGARIEWIMETSSLVSVMPDRMGRAAMTGSGGLGPSSGYPHARHPRPAAASGKTLTARAGKTPSGAPDRPSRDG